jgi:cytochrome c-type biogenesis protein
VTKRNILIAAIAIVAVMAMVRYMAGVDSRLSEREHPREAQADSPAPQDARNADDAALNFSAPDLRGRKFDLSHWRGHPMVLDFWATWCGPCRRQVPELESLFEKYNKSKGLVVVGVACDSVRDGISGDIEGFISEFGISYPILVGNSTLVDSLGVQAIPTTFFVDERGRVVDRITGAGHPGELSNQVEALLKGRRPPAGEHQIPGRPKGDGGRWVDIGWIYPQPPID